MAQRKLDVVLDSVKRLQRMGATANLVTKTGADVAGIAVLMELSFLNGRAPLEGIGVRSLLTV